MATIISVDSVVYNMAGEEENRPQFLKSLVVRNVLSGTRDSMSTTINNGLLNGPAIKMRGFYNWAGRESNFDIIGMPTGRMTSGGLVDPAVVGEHIPHPPEMTVFVEAAELGTTEYGRWVEQWFYQNQPDDLYGEWTADIDTETNQITILFPDDTSVSFMPVDFDWQAEYIYAYYYLVDEADVAGPTDLFIYRIGSGNAELDALAGLVTTYGQFFPYVPVRLNNKFLSEEYLPDAYRQAKRAYKKLTGSSFDKFVDELSDNEDLDDIDYTYIVPGVSLNVIENACKKYLYKFLEKMQATQSGGPNLAGTWATEMVGQESVLADWVYYVDNVAGQRPPGGYRDPIPPPPPRPILTTVPVNRISIKNAGATDTDYNMRLTWLTVSSGSGTGKAKTGAKKGELWFEKLGRDDVAMAAFMPDITRTADASLNYEKTRLYWQREDESYTYVDIVGFVHENFVYRSKAVLITAKDALDDTEESGFIVPLHYETYREMSLVDASQMATACVFAVFNCYKVYKTKWYESGLFKIILVIVIAIGSVVFTGGAGLGLLGTNFAVGSALGFTGLSAAIVGSVANAMAALVLVTIIEKVAVAVFGEALGGLIAAFLMIAIGGAVSAYHLNGSFAFDWGNLLKADNLLKLTDAVGRGYAGFVQGEIQELGQKMEDYSEWAKNEAEKIQQRFFEEFGYGAGSINPLMFLDSTDQFLAESSDTFLTRTLMTGSEIAEMSRELLYNFPEYSLKLPDAFT